jgi:hypothetical protein
MSLIVAGTPASLRSKFSNSSMQLSYALHLPVFKPDLTKSRLNGAPYLCEMLLGTLSGRGINGGLDGFVLGVV